MCGFKKRIKAGICQYFLQIEKIPERTQHSKSSIHKNNTGDPKLQIFSDRKGIKRIDSSEN